MKKEFNETTYKTANRNFWDFLGELPNPVVYFVSILTILSISMIVLMIF